MNDFISREALKKKLQARHDNGEEDFDKGYNIGIETAIELLDNAPTVEDRLSYVQQAVNTIMHDSTGDSDVDKAFRNAARLIQNAIDGEALEFEHIERDTERPRCGMKLIIDIPDEAYSMVMNTTFTEDTENMFKQSAEDRRKTLQLFAILDSIKSGKPYEGRPQGEWICKDKVDGHMFGYSCSNCRNPEWQITNFCPNCGAKMKGGADNDVR